MGTLEKFVAFTEALSAERRHDIEEVLESLMGPDDVEFTAEEIAELDRRCADDSEDFIDEAVFRAKLQQLSG